MSELKLYGERDSENLANYDLHVDHMTSENLRAKYQIAGELAFRDQTIEQLRTELEKVQKDRDEATETLKTIIDDYFDWSDSMDKEDLDDIRIHEMMKEALEVFNRLAKTKDKD